MTAQDGYEGWAVLELLGHRRLIGYLSEQQVAGHAFIRIDVLTDPPATQFVSCGSVYAITPTTEDMARRAAKLSRVAPVERWELPAPVILQRKEAGDDDDEVDAEITGEDVAGSEFDGSSDYEPAF